MNNNITSQIKDHVKNIRNELEELATVVDLFDGQYDEPAPKKIKLECVMENENAVVYTAGVWPKNGQTAGIGVWWENEDPRNVSKPTANRHTKKAAEIQACTEACKIAASFNGVKKLIIKTDSDFVIKSMTEWLKKWKTNNWKKTDGTDVVYKEELLELDEYSSKLLDVKYEFIRETERANSRGYDGANILARRGADMN